MFVKIRIMYMLHKEAQSWGTLFDVIGSNTKLYTALQELKCDGYIAEDIEGQYRCSCHSSLRRYIFSRFAFIANWVGFVGGIIAILQFLSLLI